MAVLVLGAPALRAQAARGRLPLAGRVVRVSGADTLPLEGVYVVAHRIGAAAQGPVDSARAAAGGRFRFVVTAPDTSTVFLVSARHHGIGYFSEPVSIRAPAGPAGITLAVFDTSTSGPPLTVSVRHVIATAPEESGGRRILDIVQVTNSGTTTRVGPDTLSPSFTFDLPAGASGFQVGTGDVSASAIRLEQSSVIITAPFPPGEKQVVVSYELPGGQRSLSVPLRHPTARLELLVEDSGAAAGGRLRAAEAMTLEGRRFSRFTADTLRTGEKAEVRFGGGRGRDFTWAAAVLALAMLLGGAGLAFRRRSSARDLPGGEAGVEAVATRIAALDERFEGRESETAPEEWERYRALRASLKAELSRVLARR